MIGSLAAVRLPDGPTTDIGWRRPDPIQRRLYDDWGIEGPVMSWPAAPARLIRVSAALHNSRDHYVRLGEALAKELAARRGAAAAGPPSRRGALHGRLEDD